MCVLVVPDEMKASQRAQEEQQRGKEGYSFCSEFDAYWQQQTQDQPCLVEVENEQDRSFLEMIRYQPIP